MLLPAKKNYSVIENESLGIVFALEKFQRFLHQRRFNGTQTIANYFEVKKKKKKKKKKAY